MAGTADLDGLCALLGGGVEGVDWSVVLPLAARHDLLPAAWAAGPRHGLWSAVPTDVRDAITQRLGDERLPSELVLQQAWDANAVRTADLLDQWRAIETALGDAGIPVVPLKGLHALLAGWWPDPAERVMRDLDLLVPRPASDAADHVLANLGYRPLATGHHDALADHELPSVRIPGRPGAVELHTALLVSRWAPLLPARRVLGAGSPMSATDAVTHSIAHAQLQDRAYVLGRIPLRALHELSVVVRGPAGGEIEWERIAATFRARSLEHVLDAHLALARALFGAAAPCPRQPARADRHVALCTALHARPTLAFCFEKVRFLPEGFSAERLGALYGAGSPWTLRARHVIRRLGA